MTDTVEDDEDFENCIIVFIDILGFKALVRNQDKKKEAIKLLNKLKKEFTSNYEIKKLSNIKYHRKPSAAALSDSVVLSYPVSLAVKPPYFSQLASISALVLQQISVFASEALELGLLIRGSITIGELYHNDGVVCGKGLDEAQEEERKAIFPRVIMSKEIDQQTKEAAGFRDEDGVYCVDYLSIALHRGMNAFLSSGIDINLDTAVSIKKQWIDDKRAMIKETIDQLSKRDQRYKENKKAMEKWRYFESYFSRTVKAWEISQIKSRLWLLELPEAFSYKIDKSFLDQKYHAALDKCNSWRASNGMHEHQYELLIMAITEGRRALQDDYERATYLLKLQQIDVENEGADHQLPIKVSKQISDNKKAVDKMSALCQLEMFIDGKIKAREELIDKLGNAFEVLDYKTAALYTIELKEMDDIVARACQKSMDVQNKT